MRQDSRQDTPRRAGGLGSGATGCGLQAKAETGVLEPTASRLAEDVSGVVRGPDQRNGSQSALSADGPGQRTVASSSDRGAPCSEAIGLEVRSSELDELPNVRTATETDLAVELARDLEQLREASERIAATGAWLERQSGEGDPQGRDFAFDAAIADGVYQRGSARIESSGGATAGPTSSPRAAGGSVSARTGGQAVDEPSIESDRAHQRRALMKTPTEETAVTDMPRKDRRENSPKPSDAESSAPSADRLAPASHRAGQGDSATARLEFELVEAREALKRLRERAVLQTQMYGSVGAQSRKLDQRASELRARVARAQEALNERARRLQAALERERDRLRAYHAKLQHRAKEMTEWTQMRKRQLEEEVARERAAVETERASLARRERELEQRFAAHAASDQRQLDARRAELEHMIRARLTEIEREAEAKRTELEAREEALLRREAEQAARLRTFEESRQTGELGLKSQAENLARKTQDGQTKLADEMAVLRRQLEEEIGQREAELAELQGSLSAREGVVARAEAESQKAKRDLEEQQRDGAARSKELDRRDADLARLSAAMEVRERRLHEWQARMDQTEARLEVVRQGLEQEVRAAQQAVDDNKEHSERLKAQSEELGTARTDLTGKLEEVEARHRAMQEREALLAQRLAEAEQQKREYEERAGRLAAERRQSADVIERSEELDRRERELAGRIAETFRNEEVLKQREAGLRQESEALKGARRDLDAIREDLSRQESELEAQRRELEERGNRIAELDRRLQQKTQELTEERAALDRVRAERTDDVAALKEGKEKLARQQLLLDEAQLAHQIDRQQFAEQEQRLAEIHAGLEREREQLVADRNAAASERNDLNRRTAELTRESEALAGAKAAVESERAKLERESISLRDRERVVAEERSGLEAARQGAEELRLDLTKRTQETEEFRRQLIEKASRLNARKEQLAKDAATVDERLRTLRAESVKVAEKDRQIERERERLGGDRQRLEADREQLNQAAEELEQSRRTFQAGLRSLEESRRRLAEQEARLSERNGELEELRARLEGERAELQRQRQELLSLQEERSGAAHKVEALMAQAEAMQAAARRREESLVAYEQALTARAAELARAEEALTRQEREHEARSRSLAAELEALESKRKELEAVVEYERGDLEKMRSAAEAEIAAERAGLQEQARELEAARASQSAAVAAEEFVADRESAEEVRRKVEAELAQREAEVVRKEEDAESRCRARIKELDRDIDGRLAALEQELKDRRERAEREVAERKRIVEEELRARRNRLDEQIEDLRRRQAAMSQEQASFVEERRRLQEERAAIVELRRQLESEEVLTDAEFEALEVDETPDVEAGAAASAAGGSPSPEPTVEKPEELMTVAGVREVGPASSGQRSPEAETELQRMEPGGDEDEEVSRHDPRKRHAAAEVEQGAEASPDSSTPMQASVAVNAAGRRTRRIKAAGVGVATALVGCLAASLYLFWPSLDQMEVKGRVALKAAASVAPLSASDHLARMTAPEVLEKTALAAGEDAQELQRSGKVSLNVSPTGDAVELVARVPDAEQAAARKFLDAWGAAYEESLRGSVISASERQVRLAELESTRKRLLESRAAAAAKLDELQAALRASPMLGQADAVRTAKAERKAKVAAAGDEWEAAKSALAEFEASPPQGPVSPTEEQLALACAADAEVMRAIEQRDSKARELHRVLTAAMSQSQTPLASLLTSIGTLCTEVDQQFAEQTDKDIRRELEQIAVSVKDYRRQAEAFSRSWDELAPKVAAWKVGGDADLLLEYQKAAETLIRDFHSESGKTFGLAAQRADAIGRAGAEMTKRRIIQGRLLTASNACLEARNEWIVAARGTIPRHNLELKALTDSIRDLTPRIEQHRKHHRDMLTEHLTKVRADERSAESRRLRDRVEAAARQYQSLSAEYLKTEGDASVDEASLAALQRQQEQVREQAELLGRLDQESSQAEGEFERLRGSENVSLADSVVYESLPITPLSRLEPERRNRAIALGAAAAGCFLAVLCVRLGLGRRRPVIS